MIVHIVFFKLKEQDKEQNIQKIKTMLQALPASIQEIKKLEVGVDFNGSQRACELSLFTEFETVDDLQTYAVHPEHLKIVEFIKEVTEYTKVVDYKR